MHFSLCHLLKRCLFKWSFIGNPVYVFFILIFFLNKDSISPLFISSRFYWGQECLLLLFSFMSKWTGITACLILRVWDPLGGPEGLSPWKLQQICKHWSLWVWVGFPGLTFGSMNIQRMVLCPSSWNYCTAAQPWASSVSSCRRHFVVSVTYLGPSPSGCCPGDSPQCLVYLKALKNMFRSFILRIYVTHISGRWLKTRKF